MFLRVLKFRFGYLFIITLYLSIDIVVPLPDLVPLGSVWHLYAAGFSSGCVIYAGNVCLLLYKGVGVFLTGFLEATVF